MMTEQLPNPHPSAMEKFIALKDSGWSVHMNQSVHLYGRPTIYSVEAFSPVDGLGQREGITMVSLCAEMAINEAARFLGAEW